MRKYCESGECKKLTLEWENASLCKLLKRLAETTFDANVRREIEIALSLDGRSWMVGEALPSQGEKH